MIRSDHTAPPVPDAVVRARPLLGPPLRAAVGRLAPDLEGMAAYHLGWRDRDGREVDGDGGKAIRPAIALVSAEAVGARPEAALVGAVALELVHNFSIVHDDVMDGDAERRHRATLWSLYGVGQAIVVGDALLSLAHQLLLEDTRPEADAAAMELALATMEMIRGQSDDLAFESRVDVTEDECLAMSARKTGALLSCAAALGGILGGAGTATVAALRAYGRHVGLAFQAVDDVLGVWGAPSATGKPVANDLRRHKKTLPVVWALRRGGPVGDELAGLLSNGGLSERAVERAVALLEAAGARDATERIAAEHLRAAEAALDGARLAPGPATELRAIASFVVGRSF